jgi:glycosyltransferase involved in cell wall biosynthesis
MINVLVITSYYPRKDSPYFGVFVREHIRAALSTEKVDTRVIFPYIHQQKNRKENAVSTDDSSLTWKVENNDIPVMRKAITRGFLDSKLKLFGIIRYALWGLRMFRKARQEKEIDLIHVQESYPAGIIAYIANKLYGTPYVVTQHFGPFSALIGKKLKGPLVRLIMENSEMILCVSNPQIEEIKVSGIKGNFSLIPNPVNTDYYVPKNYSGKMKKRSDINAIFVGRIGRRKGIDYLIRSISMLDKSTLAVFKMTIAGEGVKRAEYENLVNTLNLGDVIHFTGEITDDKKLELLRNSDFFVLPSIHENFACVLTETLACGKPVLATSCGGPTDFVEPSNGILVEPENEEKLRDGILTMCNTSYKYDPDKIRQSVIDNYSYHVVGQKLVEVYNQIIRKHAG